MIAHTFIKLLFSIYNAFESEKELIMAFLDSYLFSYYHFHGDLDHSLKIKLSYGVRYKLVSLFD